MAFVDLVASGATFGNLLGLLGTWCDETHLNWNSVGHKVRLVGITRQTKTSPKTWRWQQQAGWIDALRVASIKNVSVPSKLWDFLGNEQAKTTQSYTPWRWGKTGAALPPRQGEHLEALRAALQLFDAGRAKTERLALASELIKQQEMRHRWLRQLVLELR